MQNSFSYERFRTYTRFETEAQGNSEMAYILGENTPWSSRMSCSIGIRYLFPQTSLSFNSLAIPKSSWTASCLWEIFRLNSLPQPALAPPFSVKNRSSVHKAWWGHNRSYPAIFPPRIWRRISRCCSPKSYLHGHSPSSWKLMRVSLEPRLLRHRTLERGCDEFQREMPCSD